MAQTSAGEPSPHVIVLAIHGIGDTARGYSDHLRKAVSPWNTGAYWAECLWSNIPGEAAHAHWTEISAHGRGAGLLTPFFWLLRMNPRLFLYRFASDVLIYLSPIGPQIRRRVMDALKFRFAVHTNCEVPHYLDVVAHSLGTVIAYDILRDAHQDASLNPGAGETTVVCSQGGAKLLLRNVMTLGSPLALMWHFEPNRYPQFVSAPDPFNTSGVWLNFHDSKDLLAFPLERLFNDPLPSERTVEDIRVSNTKLPHPGRAHTRYWQSNSVATQISRELAGQRKAR